MGVRKNIKFLSAAEKENYVKACVLMKADIVNPGAAAAAQYSKWDEFVAVHKMIQNAFAPGAPGVNFGHGGPGAYSFLSWHRYFLYTFEKQMQVYVPGIMLPYWDWTFPDTIAVDTFLGPSGTMAAGYLVQTGYFAFDKPGVGANTTPLPAWWPASLPGWRLPTMFPAVSAGGLKRKLRTVTALPTVNDQRQAMAMTDYHSFHAAVEAGVGLSSGNIMHNAMHGFIGDTVGHMTTATVSAFDPFFYVLHCNIDRLWAMWQMDGHQTEYPTSGGKVQHHRNDLVYPWVGTTPGYGTNAPMPGLPMPDFSAIGPIRNVDTLDFRNAFGYTYDTIPIIGIGLDRTGSMLGVTPDPMTTSEPDVTKWEAAKRGVSAFLQDCETVQASLATYVMAGVKTFRSLFGNDFNNVFGAPGYGLIKNGTPFSKAGFETAIGSTTPGGGTPLADALTDVQNTLVQAPFGGLPADEQRYMAFLTDGLLTSGAPLSSIPNGSLSRTAIFAMGFGTGADVDYPTLAAMVAKGKTLPTMQIFHGENAGTIDKFYSNALASAIGFTSIFDPVVELFAGEHTHLSFTATSADDAFFITAQGMDFQDRNWSFMLHGPNDQVLYGDAGGHAHGGGHCNHCCTPPDVTAKRANGRLSLMIQRGTTDKDCWVGNWELMILYKARKNDVMLMPELGELLFPVSAGPIRGERYARLLTRPKARLATRNVFTGMQHALDILPAGTNNNDNEACNIVVNIYARTSLKLNLHPERVSIRTGEELKITVVPDINVGSVKNLRGLVRFVSPAVDIDTVISPELVARLVKQLESPRRNPQTPVRKFDVALQLAAIEKEGRCLAFTKDNQGNLVAHDGGPFHLHEHATNIPGIYHFGVYVEGIYYPGVAASSGGGHDHGAMVANMEMPADNTTEAEGERYVRILNISVAVSN